MLSLLTACETSRAIRPGLAVIPLNRPAPPVEAAPSVEAREIDDMSWRIDNAALAPAAPAVQSSPIRSFNVVFDQAPIAAIADAVLGQSLRRSFRIDPSVQGNLTFSLTGRMSEVQALSSLDRALRSANAALVAEGAGYAIVPSAQANRLSAPPVFAQDGASGLTGSAVYQARSIGAAEIARLLGCRVTGRFRGEDNPHIANMRPDDPGAINGHAMFGDGSPREAQFREVSLADLGSELQDRAANPNSSVARAIEQAAITGDPVTIQITNVPAGGQLLSSRTSIGQQGGIGRFAVNIEATFYFDDGGNARMSGNVTGVPDDQDYPHDSRRTGAGTGMTNFGRNVQRLGGGEDFTMSFSGSQNIDIIFEPSTPRTCAVSSDCSH